MRLLRYLRVNPQPSCVGLERELEQRPYLSSIQMLGITCGDQSGKANRIYIYIYAYILDVRVNQNPF
jgi:hypothetical protein